MDPILQQLHRYYQQQQQPKTYGAKGRAVVAENTAQLVFSPWWLKLRATLQREVAHNTQAATKYFTQIND